MKTLTATIAALATVATLTAAPAMAENVAYEQRIKLQNILNKNANSANTAKQATAPRKSVQAVSTTVLSGPERVLKRLRETQPVPAGR